MPEIDILIGELDADEEDDPADEVPELGDDPPVTRAGDIWCIGKHRLLCGDATDPAAYARLLDGAAAQMRSTERPDNVPIECHVSALATATPSAVSRRPWQECRRSVALAPSTSC